MDMIQGYYSNGAIIPDARKLLSLKEDQLVYIVPTRRKKSKAILNKHHAAGILHRYANPSLINSEREVFADALVAKHIKA